MTFLAELDVAKRLARDAGRVILEVYATAFDVVEKSGGQGPVTEADHRANELIVNGLRAAFPQDSIIAEESHRRDETSSSRRWFVDPLDGTREFADRNGMFAVHIGLAVDGVAAAGVVYAPVTGKLYAGVVGGEATLELDGVTTRLRVPHKANTRDLHLLVSRSHRSTKTATIMQQLGITRVTEQGSVGLKAGLIAEGAADLYLHPSTRSSRWDSCAPEAILRAAGGVMTDFSGNPYPYDGVQLENRRGIVACSPQVFEAVMPIVRAIAAAGGLT
jgi:3'(2'), 5'-bisphosphate nucleotidase